MWRLQPLSPCVIRCTPALAQPPTFPAPTLGKLSSSQGRKIFLFKHLSLGQLVNPQGQSSQIQYRTVLGLTAETKCQKWIFKHKILFDLFHKPIFKKISKYRKDLESL